MFLLLPLIFLLFFFVRDVLAFVNVRRGWFSSENFFFSFLLSWNLRSWMFWASDVCFLLCWHFAVLCSINRFMVYFDSLWKSNLIKNVSVLNSFTSRPITVSSLTEGAKQRWKTFPYIFFFYFPPVVAYIWRFIYKNYYKLRFTDM